MLFVVCLFFHERRLSSHFSSHTTPRRRHVHEWLRCRSLSQPVVERRSAGEQVSLVDVNDWDSAARDSLRASGFDGTVATRTSGGATRELMSNESRLLDLLPAEVVAGPWRGGQSPSVLASTHAELWALRRAYFHAEEKRNTFVELPDNVPADVRASHVEKVRKALYGTRPAAASGSDEPEKRARHCRAADSVISLVPLREQCMVTTLSMLDLAKKCSR